MAFAQTIRIYLKHHTDTQLRPSTKVCRDWTDRKGLYHRGCGATCVAYKTYPRQKTMLFDREPRQAENPVALGDGGIIGTVYTDTVHFATCGMRDRQRTGEV